jgi:hypothetical protein
VVELARNFRRALLVRTFENCMNKELQKGVVSA